MNAARTCDRMVLGSLNIRASSRLQDIINHIYCVRILYGYQLETHSIGDSSPSILCRRLVNLQMKE